MFFILNLSFCDAILILIFRALRKDTDMNIRELLKDKTETYFRGTTDKNPLTYTAGERMFFTVTFYADGEAVKLPWGKITIDGDDGSHEDFCMQPDENGVFTIETSLARDGYIKVIIQACDEDKQIIESISSKSFPAKPTKGSPCRSSCSPGPSPTNMISAGHGPTPNTTLVRVFASSHLLQ